MHDEMVSRVMNADAKLCIEAMQSSAEAALGRANWIRSTKVETLQALVVYLVSSRLLSSVAKDCPEAKSTCFVETA